MDFSILNDQEFARIGKAWYQENLKRHPLQTKDDLQVYDYMAFTEECNCLKPCSCESDESFDVNQTCPKCRDWGRVADPACSECKGEEVIYKLNKVDSNKDRDARREMYDDCEKKREQIFTDNYIESLNYADSEDMIIFMKKIMAKLGASLINDPFGHAYGEGYCLAVSLPKFLPVDA